MRLALFRFFLICTVTLSVKMSLHALTEEDKGSYLVLNSPAHPGFGAVLSAVLTALDIYDQGGYAGIKIDLNSGLYLDSDYGPNWWEYFFEPIEIGDADAPHYVFDFYEFNDMINRGFPMSRKRAKELIDKYIHLKTDISDEINAFTKKFFKRHYVIGVHYRGTDKKFEMPLIPYTTYLFHVNWWMKQVSKKKKPIIFAATDDQGFLAHIRSLYPKKVVFNTFVRSSDGDPIHYGKNRYKSNYQKGKEALIDCLLLSKCDLLLFPAASAFSMLSLKFNPELAAIPLSACE